MTTTEALEKVYRDWQAGDWEGPTPEEMLCEFMNCKHAEIHEAGELYIENPQQGHYLNDDDAAKFVDFLRVKGCIPSKTRWTVTAEHCSGASVSHPCRKGVYSDPADVWQGTVEAVDEDSAVALGQELLENFVDEFDECSCQRHLKPGLNSWWNSVAIHAEPVANQDSIPAGRKSRAAARRSAFEDRKMAKPLTCKRCGHKWTPRVKKPKRCANKHCKSAYWDRDRVYAAYDHWNARQDKTAESGGDTPESS